MRARWTCMTTNVGATNRSEAEHAAASGDATRRVLSGNEAIARGAWEAGVGVAAAYPGTPSTEILEELARYPGVYCEWSTNEKVAVDVAAGAAYAGRRALAAMKHVGLNVASDSLMYASYTGVESGLVVVSADDPGMHSSQNEQDNRWYAKLARVPCVDPADSQECKDFVGIAFELSEAFDTPVLLRTTTRVNHSSTVVELGVPPKAAAARPRFPRDVQKYVLVPSNARVRHRVVEERLAMVAGWAEGCRLNRVEWRDTAVGIVTGGVSYQYAREVFPTASILKLGLVHPLPPRLVANFAAKVGRLVVLEELDPFLEDAIRLLGIECEGKSIFPLLGELDIAIVREAGDAAGLPVDRAPPPAPFDPPVSLPDRPPVLCAGCSHRGVFQLLSKKRVAVSGDIGCYTLGFTPPLSALHFCGCMGASAAVAHGAAQAGVGEKMVAIMGDSTFYHSGLPAIANAAYNRASVVVIIVDNRTTGMTGHQANPGTGTTLQDHPAEVIEIESLVRALGVRHVESVGAFDLENLERTYQRLLDVDGPAVLVVREPCALLPEPRRRRVPVEVLEDCNGCGVCFRVGCPAILKSGVIDPSTGKPVAWIDPSVCTGCEVCTQVCPHDAITWRDQMCEPQETAQGGCGGGAVRGARP